MNPYLRAALWAPIVLASAPLVLVIVGAVKATGWVRKLAGGGWR